jgi:hypothetical protein
MAQKGAPKKDKQNLVARLGWRDKEVELLTKQYATAMAQPEDPGDMIRAVKGGEAVELALGTNKKKGVSGLAYASVGVTTADAVKWKGDGLLPRAFHPLMALHSDSWDWVRQCLPAAQLDVVDAANRVLITIFGPQSAGMSNHSDVLPTASWHAHLHGAKLWTVCSPTNEGQCFEGVLTAGQILWYGAFWYHETECMEDNTVTFAGSGADYSTNLHHQKFKGRFTPGGDAVKGLAVAIMRENCENTDDDDLSAISQKSCKALAKCASKL